MSDRQQVISAIKAKREVSVLVIGGGVNGIGTFRDLAHQGVDVLLVEKGDFSSGASAGSSHMLHGGIRYLENGEFRLVSEALTERNLMLRNAPHYAKPLPTTIPIFSLFSGFLNAPLKFLRLIEKPAERGAAVIKLGLIFYDWFARKHRVMPTHRMIGRAEALQSYPGIHPDVKYVARYYDAWMPYPERICLELVQDGEAVNPDAHALNYVSAVGAANGRVQLRDELTGETFEVQPKVVVNAAGPWIDFAMRALGKPTGFIGGTNGGEFFFENHDGRIVLILPYLDGKVMVGTTDIRIQDPEDAVCTDDEIDYMLTLVSRVFPGFTVGREHIVFTFSGVRPLPASDKGYTGNVSRDHSIAITEAGEGGLPFPVLSLIGGKWTTFRAFSEQSADAALQRLGKPRATRTE
nr:glycerol-3-phosphate dehydrogenase/oxidase [Anaerolineae bacterium]